jgi:hypothetical protein
MTLSQSSSGPSRKFHFINHITPHTKCQIQKNETEDSGTQLMWEKTRGYAKGNTRRVSKRGAHMRNHNKNRVEHAEEKLKFARGAPNQENRIERDTVVVGKKLGVSQMQGKIGVSGGNTTEVGKRSPNLFIHFPNRNSWNEIAHHSLFLVNIVLRSWSLSPYTRSGSRSMSPCTTVAEFTFSLCRSG